MRIKLLADELAKKALGLCIVPSCHSKHGKNMNVCYNCKYHRSKLASIPDPTLVAYQEYCKTHINMQLPTISRKEFNTLHKVSIRFITVSD